jgi:hypothetical protein
MSGSFSKGRFRQPGSPPCVAQSEGSQVPARDEQLRRWAMLVAQGESPVPTELEPNEFVFVLAEAGRLRRERLIRFLSRAIADDLNGGHTPS